MKTRKIYLTVMVALLGFSTVFGLTKTEKFKVYGNCGMCESRIEKAAKEVDGVISADWDKTTKQMVVEYNESKTTLEAIHKAIAKVGYDTDVVKADETVYDALPGCCQYDRNSDESTDHSEHSH
jgi:copper chaperone CopZ